MLGLQVLATAPGPHCQLLFITLSFTLKKNGHVLYFLTSITLKTIIKKLVLARWDGSRLQSQHFGRPRLADHK
ncbi:hypothetical protein AAY473_002017, partial [Plecturocebus cupreus]